MKEKSYQPPTPCDQDVFKNGKPLLWADTGAVGGANIFEDWILKIRKRSGQQIDWHYSGGVAQVLYLGDLDKINEAIQTVPHPNQITVMRWCQSTDQGLYREGVTPTPDNAIAADWQGGGRSTFYRSLDT